MPEIDIYEEDYEKINDYSPRRPLNHPKVVVIEEEAAKPIENRQPKPEIKSDVKMRPTAVEKKKIKWQEDKGKLGLKIHKSQRGIQI